MVRKTQKKSKKAKSATSRNTKKAKRIVKSKNMTVLDERPRGISRSTHGPAARKPVRFGKIANEEHHFYANDGQVLHHFDQLPAALRRMNADTFNHHVNEEKHDFANWVENVMQKKAVAKQLRSARTKTALLRV
ncbi:hypothetical protein CL620_02920, partial [archaeon]|nr:hypothetical protein [archaeon]